jgi:PAS domain S-box-containing protein
MAAPEAISPSGVEQSLITAVASVLAIRRVFEPVAVMDAVARRATAGGPQLLRPVARILTKPQVCVIQFPSTVEIAGQEHGTHQQATRRKVRNRRMVLRVHAGLLSHQSGILMERAAAGRDAVMITEAGLRGDAATLYRAQVRGLRDYAIFMADVHGTILTWNKGVEELLGYPEREFVGQHASIIFTDADRAADVPGTEMERARQEGQAANIRWHQRKDGTHLYTHGALQALRAEDGDLIGYVKVISDETRQKRLEDALMESNASLSQFSHAVAHDLLEPSRTIRAYSELLERSFTTTLPEEPKKILAYLQQGASRMQQLVEDLLAWSHLASEDEPGYSVSLNDDIEAAITQLRTAIEESGAAITHDPLPAVRAKQGQMVRLFQNLLSNSLKYRKVDEPPIIHVSATHDDDWWTIAVQDNGIGFDQKYANEIFGVFKRLHTENYAGTGMGLALARRIVERHGGRIWAESTPNRGSTFYFQLPVVKP